jgi:hypothetical protein
VIDALGLEVQFLDHLAPVWRSLPPSARGRFHVDLPLVERARSFGIEPTPMDAMAHRQTPQAGPVHDGIPTLVASIGDIKVGRRLGHGPYVFLEHGAGQGYDGRDQTMASYAGGPDRADNAAFLCPNDYSAARWRTAYPRARVEVVGSPRLDDLPPRADGPLTIAVSFHGDWPRATPYGGNALPDFAPALPLLAERFQVIGHAHPGQRWGERMERLYRRHGIEYVPDFLDVCRRADVYVCDNSSTIFEFASTGRPVVLMNAATWHRKGGPGLRFWDAAHVGVNADRREDLIPAVERALDLRPEDVAAREDALAFVYPYRTGGAERAARVIVDWLASRDQVAA